MNSGEFDGSTIVEVLKKRASGQPHRIAFRFLGDGETETTASTYSDLVGRATVIAREITEKSNQGDRVLLLMEPGVEFIYTLIGCMLSRRIAVPAYPPKLNRESTRLDAVIADCNAILVAGTQKVLDSLEHFPTINKFAAINVSELLRREPELDDILGLPKPNELAFLQYTSGSTGNPKGVMLSHRNLAANLSAIQTVYGFNPASRMISWLPLFHDMGLIGNLLEPLWVGCETVLMPPAAFIERPIRWLDAISRYRGTISGAPNFAFDLCMKRVSDEEAKTLNLSSLDVLYCGAEPIRPSTITGFFNRFRASGLSNQALFPCYGLAEATLLVSGGPLYTRPKYAHFDPQELANSKLVKAEAGTTLSYCGVVAPNHSVKIVDPETLETLSTDEIGEIWVNGPSVAEGYWGKPELSQETYRAKPAKDASGLEYLRTGDLGAIIDGHVVVCGRIKDLIIVSGKNVHPQDLELTVATACPSLRDGRVAFFSWPTHEGEQIGVVAEVNRTALRDDLKAVCSTLIEEVLKVHGLPVSGVMFIKPGALPITSSGKLQRSLTRKQFLSNKFESVFQWASPRFMRAHE